MKHVLQFLAFTLLSLQSALATRYYVQKEGNDANAGTSQQTAFATIQKGVDSAVAAGDIVSVQTGVYTENVYRNNKGDGASGNPITIESDGFVKIVGYLWVKGDPWLVIQGFEIDGNGVFLSSLDTGGLYIEACDNSVVNDMTIHDVNGHAVFLGDSTGQMSQNITLNRINVDHCQLGISIHGLTTGGITLNDCVVTRLRDYAGLANTQDCDYFRAIRGANITLNRCYGYGTVEDDVIKFGTHTGSNGAATLSTNDASTCYKRIATNELNGYTIKNVTTGATGVITANTVGGTSTITATLTGGTRQTWNAGDVWAINDYPHIDGIQIFSQNTPASPSPSPVTNLTLNDCVFSEYMEGMQVENQDGLNGPFTINRTVFYQTFPIRYGGVTTPSLSCNNTTMTFTNCAFFATCALNNRSASSSDAGAPSTITFSNCIFNNSGLNFTGVSPPTRVENYCCWYPTMPGTHGANDFQAPSPGPGWTVTNPSTMAQLAGSDGDIGDYDDGLQLLSTSVCRGSGAAGADIGPYIYPTVYYVDFDGVPANDARAGTSQATCWYSIPGTKTLDNSAYVTATYGGGVVSTANKVPANTIFKIKSGTTWNSSDGGQLWMSNAYYLASPTYTLDKGVVIMRDTTWGSGQVVIDGTGFYMAAGQPPVYPNGVGAGTIHFSEGGLTVDGVTTDGILIRNTPNDGIAIKSIGGNAERVGGRIQNVKFQNTGYIYVGPPGGAMGGPRGGAINASGGSYQLWWTADGGWVRNCTFDGNGKFTNAMHIGDYNGNAANPFRTWNFEASNNTIFNYYGDEDDDSGIGMKMTGPRNTVIKNNTINPPMMKGLDSGCKSSLYGATIKIYNNKVTGAVYGINGNSGSAALSGNPWNKYYSAYIFNNIVENCSYKGFSWYDGGIYATFTNNLAIGSGTTTTAYGRSNYSITNNGPSGGIYDIERVRVNFYNNIGYKPSGTSGTAWQINNNIWAITGANLAGRTSDISFDSDYNSWTRNNLDIFAAWGANSGSDNGGTFTYGANGPGKASGNYYTYYGGTATSPANGSTGHFHNEANSKGTGATIATEPPFANVATGDYTLTTAYAGLNLTTQSWYIPEMGYDKNGTARTVWDIGPLESTGGGDVTPPTVTSVTVENDGVTLTINYSESVTGVSAAHYTISGGRTLSAATGSGAQWTMTISPAVYSGNTVTLSYAPGATVDLASNPLASFSGRSIFNNSGQFAPVDTTGAPKPRHRKMRSLESR